MASECQNPLEYARKTLGMPNKKLFVANLSHSATEVSLINFFQKYGPVDWVVVAYDRNSLQPRGFGFITMRDEAGAQRAVEDPNPVIDGKPVMVQYAVKVARKLSVGQPVATPDATKSEGQSLSQEHWTTATPTTPITTPPPAYNEIFPQHPVMACPPPLSSPPPPGFAGRCYRGFLPTTVPAQLSHLRGYRGLGPYPAHPQASYLTQNNFFNGFAQGPSGLRPFPGPNRVHPVDHGYRFGAPSIHNIGNISGQHSEALPGQNLGHPAYQNYGIPGQNFGPIPPQPIHNGCHYYGKPPMTQSSLNSLQPSHLPNQERRLVGGDWVQRQLNKPPFLLIEMDPPTTNAGQNHNQQQVDCNPNTFNS